MKQLIVFFKGGAAVTISNYEYETLKSGDDIERRHTTEYIAQRISAGAVMDMTITPSTYIAKDDGDGEVRF